MDGLLIDSEPLWKDAAEKLFDEYGLKLTAAQYAKTTGLRTKEFLEHWFTQLHIPGEKLNDAEKKIVDDVINLIKQKGRAMPGLEYIFNFFVQRNFKIGLASSSPMELIQVVIDLIGIRSHISAVTSAAELNYGKPHPEVYLKCAVELKSSPDQCICFEDSFNGMIAVKAAKMKCIVVPSVVQFKDPVWEAADFKIATLNNFNELLLSSF